jgi:hypothetical protein
MSLTSADESLSPEQLAALDKLRNTSDSELLAQARRRGIDVEALVREQRARIEARLAAAEAEQRRRVARAAAATKKR